MNYSSNFWAKRYFFPSAFSLFLSLSSCSLLKICVSFFLGSSFPAFLLNPVHCIRFCLHLVSIWAVLMKSYRSHPYSLCLNNTRPALWILTDFIQIDMTITRSVITALFNLAGSVTIKVQVSWFEFTEVKVYREAVMRNFRRNGLLLSVSRVTRHSEYLTVRLKNGKNK